MIILKDVVGAAVALYCTILYLLFNLPLVDINGVDKILETPVSIMQYSSIEITLMSSL